MSTAPGGNGGRAAHERPRRVVASFSRYREAERAVDQLADSGFPVERTTIVGHGLRFVERVTGRFSYTDAALRGALSGAVAGLLIAWLFGVFNWFDPSVAWGWLIFDGLWFGALAGTLIGLTFHAMTGGRRDFSSVPGMEAERYDLLVDEEVADDATRMLGVGEQAPTTERPTTERTSAQASR